MNNIIGTSNRVLEIDLTKQQFDEIRISEEDRKMYLGGKGLGLKLLYDRMEPGIDPLGEDNIIAVMMGVYLGTGAPCSGRFAAVTKSPLTGIMASASCGGPFGMALKTSGWDGILIRGKSTKPVYLVIDSFGVEFKNARSLWGKNTGATQKALQKKGNGVLVIGPAGENMVRLANIRSGKRFLGRCGMGTVMGSKNLKAIVAKGNEFKIIPEDQKKFKRVKKKALKFIKSNEITSVSYKNFGTCSNVNITNAAGILPVYNFQDGTHKDAYKISGEEIKKNHDTKFSTCIPCSILCGHTGTFDKKELAVPEYETVGLLGSNLGVFDPIVISKWNEICRDMGIDTISAGGTIAWVMEAIEKGLIKSKLKLKFGSPNGVSKALNDMANLKGFGKEMAMGVRALSEKYGGKEFAIHVKGLEMAAYDPRGCYGMGLSYAVANRGACHLSATIFAQEIFFHVLSPFATKNKAKHVKFMENLYSGINSLHTCMFTAYAYIYERFVAKNTPTGLARFSLQNNPKLGIELIDFSIYSQLWSAITGIKLTSKNFIKAGERIHVLERYMNTREGISKKDDTLPERMLNEGRKSDYKKRTVPLNKMLNKYYNIRGFDNNGIPEDRTLENLGIAKKA